MSCVTLKSCHCVRILFMGILFYLIEHIFLLKASCFVSLDLMIIIHPEWGSVALYEILSHFRTCWLPCDINPNLCSMMSKGVIGATGSVRHYSLSIFIVDCRISSYSILLKNIVLIVQCNGSCNRRYSTKHSSPCSYS